MTTERLLLIVEDDAAFARTLSRSFERRGYRVLLAENVDEASGLLVHPPAAQCRHQPRRRPRPGSIRHCPASAST
ncbi:MAG: hypothetical protein ACEQSK_20265, partial [Sphingomonadaceae bacterium]